MPAPADGDDGVLIFREDFDRFENEAIGDGALVPMGELMYSGGVRYGVLPETPVPTEPAKEEGGGRETAGGWGRALDRVGELSGEATD